MANALECKINRLSMPEDLEIMRKPIPLQWKIIVEIPINREQDHHQNSMKFPSNVSKCDVMIDNVSICLSHYYNVCFKPK